MIIFMSFIVSCSSLENEILTVPNYKLFRNDTLFENGTIQLIDTNGDPDCDLDELVDSGRFVDKTNIIKQFLQAKEYAIMVSAPARFGKSINMALIKRFCDIVVFDNLTVNQEKMNENFDFFSLNDFNIRKDDIFFTKHIGRNPVIFLDFKHICVENWTSFYASFKRLVMTTFNRFRYILQSKDLHEKERNRFVDFILGKRKKNPYVTILFEAQNMVEDDMLNSIFTLSYLVHYSLNESMGVILIDNYDAPVIKAFNNLYGSSDRNGTMKIIRYLYRFTEMLVKPDQYVERVMLNVRHRIGPVPSIKGVPLITYFPFWVNNIFSSFYGFTEAEVKTSLHRRKLLYKFNDVHDWYGGFTVTNSTLKLYNPYSVMKYLETGELKIHWADTCYLNNTEKLFLRNLINSRVKRINRKITKINYMEVFNKGTIFTLRDIINNPDTYKFTKKVEVEAVLQVMGDIGFFQIGQVNLARDDAVLQIPNREIRQFFYEKGILSQQ